MRSINTFFKVIFDIKENSDAGLLNFAHNHVEMLKNQNSDGKYDYLIQETNLLFQKFFEAYTVKQKTGSKKKLQTSETDFHLDQYKKHISKLNAYILAFHNKETKIYKSFFPNGLSEYSRITKENISTLMSRISDAIEIYHSQLDGKILTNISDTEQLYNASRDEQLKRKNLFKSTIKNKKEHRKNLAVQLQINLFELAKEHIGNTNKESLFFNMQLLQKESFDLQKILLLENAMELTS